MTTLLALLLTLQIAVEIFQNDGTVDTCITTRPVTYEYGVVPRTVLIECDNDVLFADGFEEN